MNKLLSVVAAVLLISSTMFAGEREMQPRRLSTAKIATLSAATTLLGVFVVYMGYQHFSNQVSITDLFGKAQNDFSNAATSCKEGVGHIGTAFKQMGDACYNAISTKCAAFLPGTKGSSE